MFTEKNMNRTNGLLIACLGTAAAMLSVAHAAHAQERSTIACSSEQESAVWTYQAYAGLELLTASSYIGTVKDGSGDPERFDYWFGNHEADTVAAVEQMMSLIYYGTMADAQYRCDCAPDTESGVVAYVYPSDPDYNVYLCAPFFNAAPESFSTWVFGVVSHELSHFHGTTDYPYGGDWLPNYPEGAHSVALDDPALAVNTSYNYQFFLANQAH
jgi:hypothetical protein